MSNNNENDKILHLIIGDGIPDNAPAEFKRIILYIRNENDGLNIYSDITLPCMINHSRFLNIVDDPRYYFYENFDQSMSSCRNFYTLKPLGTEKGLYRILDGSIIKIFNIESLIPEEEYKSYVIQKNS